MKAGAGKSRTDRDRIPCKPIEYRLDRKNGKTGKNGKIRRERERKRLGLFPDRIRGSRILPGTFPREFPVFSPSLSHLAAQPTYARTPFPLSGGPARSATPPQCPPPRAVRPCRLHRTPPHPCRPPPPPPPLLGSSAVARSPPSSPAPPCAGRAQAPAPPAAAPPPRLFRRRPVAPLLPNPCAAARSRPQPDPCAAAARSRRRAPNPTPALHKVFAPQSIPIIALSFVYQNVVPVLCTNLDGDLSKVRTAIIAGTAIPLALFLVWDGVILGTLPGIAGSSTVSDPLELLRSSNGIVGPIVEVLSFLAIGTSYIGFVLGLSDFLADLLKLPSGQNNPLPYLLTLLPPLLLSLLDPEIFFKALDFAGTYGSKDLFLLYLKLFHFIIYYPRKHVAKWANTDSTSLSFPF
ncbi:uncharacterized protein C2845_PM12G30040 [Panicum miliaceum]|uniref:Uncharacterized protein n=1 Tax=Panicum miliaceum TaxID=4540 RepID=A0A3L6QEV5_PANMI|nr:uncharacterized protein C2845_PM12G30040 [Panicum miliaceum]